MRYSLFFGALLVLLFSTACQDQLADLGAIDATRYEADYAIPLVDSRIGMRDILENFEENSTLTIDADGLLRFRYSGDILTRTSDDVFAAINQTIGNSGILPLLNQRQALPFSTPDGLEIDRVEMKETTLTYAFTNRHPVAVEIELRMPNVALNGEPLFVSASLPAYSGTGTAPGTSNALNPLSLDGYSLTPEGDSIYIDILYLTPEGDTLLPSAGSGLLIENFSFTYAEGYLGNIEYTGERDTILIDFFDNWIQGDVYFEQPKITFNFENSFGVPTEAVVDLFNIITAEGETLPLESVFIDQGGIQFPYPTLEEVGQVKTTQFLFDRSNSNIDVVLGSKPVAIDYDVSALTNPDNNTAIRGFITDTSYYKVLVDVELPLYGSAANFVVRDTFDIDLSSYPDVKAIAFKIVTENGLPLSVALQGNFLDANNQSLAQLFPDAATLVGGAPVDSQGEPTASRTVTSFSEWDETSLPAIRMANRLVLTSTFSTTLESAASVRLLSGQEVNVKIGAILTRSN